MFLKTSFFQPVEFLKIVSKIGCKVENLFSCVIIFLNIFFIVIYKKFNSR